MYSIARKIKADVDQLVLAIMPDDYMPAIFGGTYKSASFKGKELNLKATWDDVNEFYTVHEYGFGKLGFGVMKQDSDRVVFQSDSLEETVKSMQAWRRRMDDNADYKADNVPVFGAGVALDNMVRFRLG